MAAEAKAAINLTSPSKIAPSLVAMMPLMKKNIALPQKVYTSHETKPSA